MTLRVWHVPTDVKLINVMMYGHFLCGVPGDDIELTCHDGTVRDLVFMQDATSRSSLLVSGGAGDCKICITDCETGSLVRSMAGHAG